jgi:hypothetical protein
MDRPAVVDAPAPGRRSFGVHLRSPRARRRAEILVALTVVAGGIGLVVALVPSTSHRLNSPISTEPAQLVPKDVPAPPDPAAKLLGRRFIETAVMRTDLDWAYDHVSADLKGRMTRTEWNKGTIPVIPYPATNAATTAFIVDYSFRTEALYEVELVAPAGSHIRPMPFYIGLKREKGRATGRWLVSYWAPHWRPPVPYSG